MPDTRTFRVTIPATTVVYEVDEEVYRDWYEAMEQATDEDRLVADLEDDVNAAFELGSFGDGDMGFIYVGGSEYTYHGDFVITEVKE